VFGALLEFALVNYASRSDTHRDDMSKKCDLERSVSLDVGDYEDGPNSFNMVRSNSTVSIDRARRTRFEALRLLSSFFIYVLYSCSLIFILFLTIVFFIFYTHFWFVRFLYFILFFSSTRRQPDIILSLRTCTRVVLDRNTHVAFFNPFYPVVRHRWTSTTTLVLVLDFTLVPPSGGPPFRPTTDVPGANSIISIVFRTLLRPVCFSIFGPGSRNAYTVDG
jgi:hypothetical protein